MNEGFIPVRVYLDESGKWDLWYCDVNNLDLEALLSFRNEIRHTDSVSSIDKLLISKTCSSTFLNYTKGQKRVKKTLSKKGR